VPLVVPGPFRVAVQAWHVPVHAVSQQTPSTQLGRLPAQITLPLQQVWPEPGKMQLLPQQLPSGSQQAPPMPGHCVLGSAQMA